MNTIKFTDKEHASLILKADHKRNGITLKIYPALYQIKSRELVDPNTVKGLKPLAKLKFENIGALDNLYSFLHTMRDVEIHRIGRAKAIAEYTAIQHVVRLGQKERKKKHVNLKQKAKPVSDTK